MSSIMRRRNGLIASSVMGMLLSDVRLGTPHLKTGRPVALSSWLCRQPQRPTARAVSSFGTFRTWRDVRVESAFGGKADSERSGPNRTISWPHRSQPQYLIQFPLIAPLAKILGLERSVQGYAIKQRIHMRSDRVSGIQPDSAKGAT